jgi:hypothetical protein
MSFLLCLYLLLIIVRIRELVVLLCDGLMLPSRKVSSSIVFHLLLSALPLPSTGDRVRSRDELIVGGSTSTDDPPSILMINQTRMRRTIITWP